jgi:hypothetical protein
MHARLAAFGLAFVFMLSAAAAQAEILKTLRMCPEQQLCPVFELAIEPPPDWVLDKEASEQNGVQIIVPSGRTFGDAPALIYVKVSSRQDGQSVEDFVRVSQERWREAVSDTKIEKLADVARANGKPAFLSYSYENPSVPQQQFEVVSFGLDEDKEGNDYFVMVTITGQDKAAVDEAMPAYTAFLAAH